MNVTSHKEQEIIVPCSAGCLERIRDFVREKATGSGFNSTEIGRLVLAVDEASSNIIKHSYHFESGHALALSWQENPEKVVVELHDSSPEPHLPSTADFDVSTKVKYRQGHGYGKHLMQTLVDEILYETKPGSGNTISLIKYKKPKAVVRPQLATPKNQSTLTLIQLLDDWEKMGKEKSREDLLRIFLYSLMGYTSSRPVALLTSADPQSAMKVVGQIGCSKKAKWQELELSQQSLIVGAVSGSHETAFLGDYFKKLRTPPEELHVLESLQTAVLIPVMIRDNLRGIVSLGPKHNRHLFFDDEIRLIQSLASEVLFVFLLNDSKP